MSTAPASASEAMEMVRAGLGYLAAADATAMAAETQALCLRMLEQAHSMGTAARTSVLAAFTSGQGYSADADYSPRAWLINRTKVTKGAAVAHTAWVRRAAAHPEVAAAAGSGRDVGVVRADDLHLDGQAPEDCREDADEILLTAAGRGWTCGTWPGWPGRSTPGPCPGTPTSDKDEAFEDRSVRLETTFGGAGVLHGDLTPECASVVGRCWMRCRLRPARRTPAARRSGSMMGCTRPCSGWSPPGCCPERAGQPVKAWVHISLADLMMLEGSSALLEEWTARVRAQWAGHRARASAGGSDGGAWLDGDAAEAVACDAAMAPFVTGEVNPAALEDLVRLCVELDRLRHHSTPAAPVTTALALATPTATGRTRPATDTARAWEALERAIIGKAVDLLSGPGGLASFLRRRQLGARLGGPSLPLDIGYAETIPAGIRNAVTLRDQHCRWAGGCNQPASACEVHHVRHKKNGGKTSTRDCVLLCWFHHQVVIHRWGWTLVLNPDGTTTAWNPDRTKVLYSHGPPVRPG